MWEYAELSTGISVSDDGQVDRIATLYLPGNEYNLEISSKEAIIKILNALGAEGWELVSVTDKDMTANTQIGKITYPAVNYYFKRLKG